MSSDIEDMVYEANAVFATIVKSDIYANTAKMYIPLYHSLKVEGFTKEEAMAICTNQGLNTHQK